VTVAYDYATALAGIDRGFGEGAPPPRATNDEELGHGAAMALPVKHEGNEHQTNYSTINSSRWWRRKVHLFLEFKV